MDVETCQCDEPLLGEDCGMPGDDDAFCYRCRRPIDDEDDDE